MRRTATRDMGDALFYTNLHGTSLMIIILYHTAPLPYHPTRLAHVSWLNDGVLG